MNNSHNSNTASSAASSAASPAVAIELSAGALEAVCGGVGAENVATQPWPALSERFGLAHHNTADRGVVAHAGKTGVAVPSVVPGSTCLAFCS